MPVSSSSCVFQYALPHIRRHQFDLSLCSNLPGFQVIWNSSKPALSFTGLKTVCICKIHSYFLPIKIINHLFWHRYLQQALSDCTFIIYFSTLSSDSLPISYIKEVPVQIVSDTYLIVTAHWDIIIQHGEELLLPTPSQFICTLPVVLYYWFITFACLPAPALSFVCTIKSPEVKPHWAMCSFTHVGMMQFAATPADPHPTRHSASPCLQQGNLTCPLFYPCKAQASLDLAFLHPGIPV